jgi:hypothetical protein
MTTTAHERRLSSLEKSILAKRKGGFEGAIQPHSAIARQ